MSLISLFDAAGGYKDGGIYRGKSIREEIKNKLCHNFDSKIVRKDLTKKIQEGTNVSVYVLEFLLGQYCSSDDARAEKGAEKILALTSQAPLG